MYKLSSKRIAVIIAVCFIGFFLAVPNFLPKSVNVPSWWKPINLGLDLQGGSNLLLEVNMKEVLRERMATIEDSVRQILREHRIGYQNLKAGDDYVRVKIENSASRSQAVGYFRQIEDGLTASVVVNSLPYLSCNSFGNVSKYISSLSSKNITPLSLFL